jgi:hypothetical protein
MKQRCYPDIPEFVHQNYLQQFPADSDDVAEDETPEETICRLQEELLETQQDRRIFAIMPAILWVAAMLLL